MGLIAGTITVYVPKSVAGHHFENLGMITSLLSKKPAHTQPDAAKVDTKPLIEVLPGYYIAVLHLWLYMYKEIHVELEPMTMCSWCVC